jgi:hypothetical protein
LNTNEKNSQAATKNQEEANANSNEATTTTSTAESRSNKLPSELLKSDLPNISELENINFDITDNDLATEWVKEFENLEEKSDLNDYWNDLQSEWNSLAT